MTTTTTPGGFALGTRSRARLKGVHPDLVRVVERAIQLTPVDFTVTEGLRDAKRQAELVKAGASKTMNSRHLTGHAIDVAALVGGKVSWDWPLYLSIASAFRAASVELGLPVRWGGSWSNLSSLPPVITTAHLSRSFPDGPHFELPRVSYP
jgi:peptidoglycan L-alanyl-D-glutamate endopeptidase CwlK